MAMDAKGGQDSRDTAYKARKVLAPRGGLWVLMVIPAAGCPDRAALVGVRDSLPPGWVFPAP